MDKKSKYKTYGKSRSLRLKYFDYSQPYYMYFLTMCTYKRRTYFKKEQIAQMIIKDITAYSKMCNYDLIAYCVMPDHVHFLIQSREEARDLRDLVRDFKKFTTKEYWDMGNRGKIWQRSYYEHIVRNRKRVSAIIEYILNNPVKKGLADNYPFVKYFDGFI